jgi:PAS domain S-box-containing protein
VINYQMHREEKQPEVNILCVDDEPDFLALTKVCLERENEKFNICTTTSAENGIELLKSGNYDVILSDYKMPGMNGIEFLQNLRRDGSTIPFIMFTGKGKEEVAMDALNNGANYYLQKCGDVERLCGTLTHTIRGEAEKKRMVDKLAALEKERQIIMDSVSAMIFSTDCESNFLYVNKLLADVYGKNPEEFKGKSIRELLPEEAEDYIKANKEILKSGRPRTGLIKDFRTPEGIKRVRIDEIPLKDTDGNVIGLMGFAVDITEHKQAAEALREQEEQLSAVLDNTAIQIWAFDGVQYSYLNKEWYRYTGQDPALPLTIERWAEVVHPDDLDEALKTWYKALNSKSVYGDYFRLRNAVGEYRQFHSQAVPVYDKNGGFKYYQGHNIDITKREKAVEMAEAVRRERDRAQQYFDVAGVLLIIVDANQKIIGINRKGCEVFGYEKEEEVIGLSAFDTFCAKEYKNEVLAVFESLMRGEVEPVEYREDVIKNKHGEEKVISWHNSVLKDEEGKIYAILCSGTDVTTRKKAEERVRHLNSVLKAIRNVNQLAMQEKDRDRLLQKACDALIEARGYDAVWLGLLQDVENFAIVKGSGFKDDVVLFCEHVMSDDHPHCITNALAQKDPFFVVDRSSECGDCPFKNVYSGRTVVVIRVERAERLFGLLVISLAAEADREEMELLEEVAGDIAFALHNRVVEEAHKRAEAALRESEARSRLILQTVPSGLFTVDLNRKIASWNKEAEEITKLKVEDVIGMDCLEIFDCDACKKRCLLFDGNGDKPTYGMECVVHVDGRDIVLSKNADMLKDPAGNTIGCLESFIDITEQKQADEQIKASLKEKEVLLREIHHRVKNNLQVVSSMLNMQARITKDKDTIDILAESKNRLNAMALIHAQLYESRNLSEVNMRGFVKGLLRQLFQSYPVQDTKITPKVRVVDYPLPISLAVPVGLIINELLTNVFKHAFDNREEGEIAVILGVSEKGEVRLRVSDDGVGLPGGFNLNTTKTLGLHLVKILVEDQLQGNMEIESKKGTAFTIVFEIGTDGVI